MNRSSRPLPLTVENDSSPLWESSDDRPSIRRAVEGWDRMTFRLYCILSWWQVLAAYF